MIIGVTDESVELVDKWVAENKPEYPIVILENSAVEDSLQVQYFPTAAVVTPEGVISYTGDAGSYSSSLKKALKGATKGTVIPKAFSKFKKELKKGNQAKAYDSVASMVSGGRLEGSDLSWGRKLQAWLESSSADALKNGEAKFKDGWYLLSLEMVEPFRDSEVGFPNSAAIEKFVADMEASPTYKDEIKGGEMFEAARVFADEYEWTDFVNGLKKIYSKYPELEIGKHARKRAEQIVKDGWPGLKSACNNCRRKQRACDKHAEKIKL